MKTVRTVGWISQFPPTPWPDLYQLQAKNINRIAKGLTSVALLIKGQQTTPRYVPENIPPSQKYFPKRKFKAKTQYSSTNRKKNRKLRVFHLVTMIAIEAAIEMQLERPLGAIRLKAFTTHCRKIVNRIANGVKSNKVSTWNSNF